MCAGQGAPCLKQSVGSAPLRCAGWQRRGRRSGCRRRRFSRPHQLCQPAPDGWHAGHVGSTGAAAATQACRQQLGQQAQAARAQGRQGACGVAAGRPCCKRSCGGRSCRSHGGRWPPRQVMSRSLRPGLPQCSSRCNDTAVQPMRGNFMMHEMTCCTAHGQPVELQLRMRSLLSTVAKRLVMLAGHLSCVGPAPKSLWSG